MFLQELSSMGAVSGSIRDDMEIKANIICGAVGLATIVASDIPSGRGRPQLSQRRQTASGVATTSSSEGGFVKSVLQGLPAAEATYQEYKGEAEVKQLLAADYNKLLAIGTMEKRYGESVAFKYNGKAAARAVCVLPSNNNPWLSMQLVSKLHLPTGDAPTMFADLSSGAVQKARRGEVIFKAAHSSNKSARSQKGTAFFTALFNDLAKAAEGWKEEICKPVAVLYVDLHCWAGDSMAACLHNIQL
jgi:hypothetical protein